jgi:hypothetical protein
MLAKFTVSYFKKKQNDKVFARFISHPNITGSEGDEGEDGEGGEPTAGHQGAPPQPEGGRAHQPSGIQCWSSYSSGKDPQQSTMFEL